MKLPSWTLLTAATAVFLGAGGLLWGSCQTDECTTLVFLRPSANDWCSEYDPAQGVMCRSLNPDQGTWTSQAPATVGVRSMSYCSSNVCSGIYYLKECKQCAGGIVTGWTQVTQYTCEPPSGGGT